VRVCVQKDKVKAEKNFFFFFFSFLFFCFLFYTFVVVSVRYIKLTRVDFRVHVKTASRIVSYRIVEVTYERHRPILAYAPYCFRPKDSLSFVAYKVSLTCYKTAKKVYERLRAFSTFNAIAIALKSYYR